MNERFTLFAETIRRSSAIASLSARPGLYLPRSSARSSMICDGTVLRTAGPTMRKTYVLRCTAKALAGLLPDNALLQFEVRARNDALRRPAPGPRCAHAVRRASTGPGCQVSAPYRRRGAFGSSACFMAFTLSKTKQAPQGQQIRNLIRDPRM